MCQGGRPSISVHAVPKSSGGLARSEKDAVLAQVRQHTCVFCFPVLVHAVSK